MPHEGGLPGGAIGDHSNNSDRGLSCYRKNRNQQEKLAMDPPRGVNYFFYILDAQINLNQIPKVS